MLDVLSGIIPHGAKENEGNNANTKAESPEPSELSEREVPLQPRKIRHHAVEGNLISSSNTNESNDEGEVQKEDSEASKTLFIKKEA